MEVEAFVCEEDATYRTSNITSLEKIEEALGTFVRIPVCLELLHGLNLVKTGEGNIDKKRLIAMAERMARDYCSVQTKAIQSEADFDLTLFDNKIEPLDSEEKQLEINWRGVILKLHQLLLETNFYTSVGESAIRNMKNLIEGPVIEHTGHDYSDEEGSDTDSVLREEGAVMSPSRSVDDFRALSRSESIDSLAETFREPRAPKETGAADRSPVTLSEFAKEAAPSPELTSTQAGPTATAATPISRQEQFNAFYPAKPVHAPVMSEYSITSGDRGPLYVPPDQSLIKQEKKTASKVAIIPGPVHMHYLPSTFDFVVYWSGDESQQQQQQQQTAWEEFVELSDGIPIALKWVLIALQTKGIFDPYASHVLLHNMNEMRASIDDPNKLDLWKDIQFEALLPFVPEQKTKIADTFLTKMLNQVSRCRIGTYKYKQYLAHMLSQKQTEVTDALDDLEKDIITCLAFNHRASLDMAERLLISLQGHVNSVAREFAVRMLNVVYDFHDWQIERALPVQVVRIGDPFKVQLSLAGEDVKPESVLIQTVTPSTLPSSRNTIWMHHKPVVSGSTVTFDFNHFTRAGFYDYRFVVVMEDGSVEPVRIKGKPAQGRFIAQSKVNEERIHEVWVDVHQARWNPTTRDIVQRGSFEGIASSIDEYAKTGISTLYVMGALERNDFYPFAPTDRRSPQKSAGGSSGFNQLVHKAHERGIKVIVDSTPWLAPRPHRRYRNVLCSSVDAYGRVVPQFAIDSNYEEKTHCAMVNYRKKEAWDLLVNDVASWAREHNIDGILLEGAASLPFILEPDLAELLRRDSDNHLHYPHQDIIDGEVVVPTRKSSRVLGYWGTRASSEYPNPLFVKLARKLWERHPTFQIFGDITPIKDRESSVIISGLIPYTQQLTNLLEQGILEHSKAIAEHDKRRSARSIMSAWYDKYPQGKLPDGSLIVVPSSSHIIPYPTMRIGMGTFAHISFLLAAPETPVTYVGELDASRFSIDIMTGKLRVEKEALNKNQAERLKEHYLYRAALRKKHHLLRTGKLRMLRAKANGVEVDSVAAFVRYSAKEKELLICAVNFSSQETSFAVDLSELVDIPELELSTDDTKNPNFQLNDLLNPQNPRQHYSSFEFLNEPHFVTLYAYASMIWKAVKLPTDIASQRNILSDSISRLQSIFHAGSDPTYNHFYRTIVHALRSYETFKELLNSLAYVVPQNSDLDHKLPYIIQETIYHCTRPGAKNSYEETSIYGLLVRLNTDMYPAWPGQDLARRVLLANNIGPLVFVTPEIAPWSTIGGVAIMLDELTQDLAQLGLEIIVISPYYNFNRDGKTDYLRSEGVEHILNYDVYVAGEKCSIGLHSLKKNHVQYYFMHNYTYFPSPYHTGAPDHQLKMVVLMAKATLELMCQLRILPAVVITNDWFTALTPGYARCGDFGQTFQNATFFHLIHNLEEGYQGLIWPDSNDMFRGIHGLPEHLVVDYLGAPTVINTSRCALQTVNQWGTVSASYRDDLMRGSPFAHLLRQYPNPFAYSNGIRVGHRLKTLAKVAKSHEEAKAILQKTYFGYSDPSIPVFSFVGRITVQKGVQLILESVKTLIDAFNGKIQILVGGMANKKEKYAAHCAWQMHSLRHTYPNNFWADPEAYFTTGALVNLGSDFGLMPSLFEPSGVVQQEYFVAGTPVIAFSTGGLKDTVFEFYEGKGNGFVFMAHQHADFVYAVKRAVACFNNPEQYAKLRENARASVLDTATVAEAWGKEFFRLRKRLWLGEHFVRPKEDFEDEDGDKNAKAALAALSSAPPPPSTSTTTTTTTEAK